MISFRSTEEEAAFVEVAKHFAIENIRTKARVYEEQGRIEDDLMDELKNLGFLGLELPEDWGGLHLPLLSQVQIESALAYGDLDAVQGVRDNGDVKSLIRIAGKNSLIQQYKAELQNSPLAFIDQEKDWKTSLTIEVNDNQYMLDGTTIPVRLAKYANFFVLYTLLPNEQPALFLIENEKADVLEGDYRLGLLASGIGSLQFQQAALSHENVLAIGDEAEQLVKQLRTRIWIIQAARQVGLMEAALDYATEYTAGRKAFGQEIAKFQGVSFRIASMSLETRIAHHLVWHAAWKADQNVNNGYGAAMRALYRAHRSLRYVTDSAVQLLGGHGYVQEYPVEKWMRDAQAQVVLYGREQDLLNQWGEQIISSNEEVMFS